MSINLELIIVRRDPHVQVLQCGSGPHAACEDRVRHSQNNLVRKLPTTLHLVFFAPDVWED